MLFDERTVARFWKRVQKSDGCWLWTGNLHVSGYGRMNLRRGGADGPRFYVWAHRAAWIVAHGEIPNGLCVCHHCDNPPCVRPDHLFLGTTQDNTRDMMQKGRKRAPAGPDHYEALLSESDVREIRSVYGIESALSIARRLGVPVHVVRSAGLRRSYRSVL